LKPLPRRVFPISEVVNAFRYMAQAKHIGKIVVSQDATLNQALPLDSEGTYLITGGMGGLGLVVAKWMVKRGARNLVLVGRSAGSDGARIAVSDLEKAGARVLVVTADVSRENEIAQVLDDINKIMPPLRGIIHAAGV